MFAGLVEVVWLVTDSSVTILAVPSRTVTTRDIGPDGVLLVPAWNAQYAPVDEIRKTFRLLGLPRSRHV